MRHKRQTAIYNPADFADKEVTIIGLGNIGSHTALALARMGVAKLSLVDFDTVEDHNLSSQAYTIPQVGENKTSALVSLIGAISDAEVTIYTEPYKHHIPVGDFTVIAVDSMETRHDIARDLVQYYPHTHVIDGRMGGGQIEVHNGSVTDWMETLTASADTDECSARYISYTSYIIAGAIANTLKRLLKSETVPTSMWMHTDTMEILKK